MTTADARPPSFHAVESQMHALADQGFRGWLKSDRADPNMLLRIPQIAEAFAPSSDPEDSASDATIETCLRRAIALLRAQDFGPAALESFGLTTKSEKHTSVEDRDDDAAQHIGPRGHHFRWYRKPCARYEEMWPRYFVASQVAAALLGFEDPEQTVRDARTRETGGSPRPEQDATIAQLVDALQGPSVPEIVIAIARPIGTDTTALLQVLDKELSAVGYVTQPIKLSQLIKVAYEDEYDTTIPTAPEFKRIRGLMEAGDRLRTGHGGGAATAALAINAIARARSGVQAEAGTNHKRGVAYLITNLMHPGEVVALRNTYRSRFFLIGVFGDENNRKAKLTERLGDSSDADTLMDIDAGKLPVSKRLTDGSLSLTNTFHLADVFVTTWAAKELSVKGTHTIERFVQQLFSYPFGVPTAEETAMSLAYLAALRSSALARRVGAALVDADGSVRSLGWNDPVALGGRCYTDETEERPDFREYKVGGDPSDHFRLNAIEYFLNALSDDKTWLDLPLETVDPDLREALNSVAVGAQQLPTVSEALVAGMATVPALASTRLLNLIEFGRCVHAEMMAITNAALRGIPTLGGTLYVTTFPCHECARNIIAAGIHRVCFVSPYTKSLARELYRYEATFPSAPPAHTSAGEKPTKVLFVPYEGIAPNATDRLFSWVPRKVGLAELARDPSRSPGEPEKWDHRNADLRDSVRGYRAPQALNSFHEAATLLAEAELCGRFPFTAGRRD